MWRTSPDRRSAVVKRTGSEHNEHMSTTELKAVVDRATPEERVFLEHYLAHLRRVEDPQYAETLADRHRDMDAGLKVKWTEIKRIHRDMLKEEL